MQCVNGQERDPERHFQDRVKCDPSCAREGRFVKKMSGWFTAEAATCAKAREGSEWSPALQETRDTERTEHGWRRLSRGRLIS